MDRARAYGQGKPPAVVLVRPKYPHNVGAVIRAASCFGVEQVWMTGDRVPTVGHDGYRLPREERMEYIERKFSQNESFDADRDLKGYMDVELVGNEYPLDAFASCTPVAVEVSPTAENLIDFDHPEDAVYVFGPEDGSLPVGFKKRCHRFLYIPTYHCLNLAAAVYVVLYDRTAKAGRLHAPEDRRFVSDN